MRSTDQRLHRLMRQHFRNLIDAFGNHLDYGSAAHPNNASVTAALGGLSAVEAEFRKFYDQFPEFGC